VKAAISSEKNHSLPYKKESTSNLRALVINV
jgi:hypothetical protein